MSDPKHVFLRALAVSLLATAGLAIGYLFVGESDEWPTRVIGTTALLLGFTLVALPAAVLLDQGRAVALGWATVLLAAVGLTFSLALLWTSTDRGWNLLVVLVAFAVAAALAAGTTAGRRTDDPAPVRALYVAGLTGAVLLASMISLGAWQEVENETFFRILGSLAIAVVLAILLQPLLRRTATPPEPEAADPR